MKNKKMILFLTTIVIGLTTGIFYCWSVSVTTGLALLPDKEYITAFQALNRAILNPLFLLCFMGPVLLQPLSAFLSYHKPDLAATRTAFETQWNFLNNIRTVSCVISFGLTAAAGMLR